MKTREFLVKLKTDKKLRIVEPSEEVSSAYLKKAEKCIIASRLLMKEKLYENSIGLSYYGIYNSITSLLFSLGIKCENHSGSILLLKVLLKREDLYSISVRAKRERVKKQYFISEKEEAETLEDSAAEMLNTATDFLAEVKLIIENTKLDDVSNIRKSLDTLTK
jgi:uncharacterized protein (UPF0332 family)